jgi:hypothetical protein
MLLTCMLDMDYQGNERMEPRIIEIPPKKMVRMCAETTLVRKSHSEESDRKKCLYCLINEV